MDGESGWNLGVNRAKGTQTVFNSGMTRTTGVARVLGDLNDLFGTDMDYAGYQECDDNFQCARLDV